MKKSKIFLVVISIIFLVLLGYNFIKPYILPINSGIIWEETKISKREELVYNFVEEKLTNKNGGIKTNYINKNSEGDITKGNSVLSESEGMMLLYNLNRNDKENFDKTLNYIYSNMTLENNLISWRLEKGVKANSSATIDDLRIVKALLLADERYKDFSYRKKAVKLINGIYKNLKEENILVDFSETYGKSDKITLCYLDLETLKYIKNISSKWEKIYDKSNEIINNGFISSKVPLYRKYYNLKTKSYDTENPDTLLSCMVILHKIEVGEDVSESVNWLKTKFKEDGGIYSLYNRETGKKESQIESTSIYSLLYRIGNILNDKELKELSLEKLKAYQVLDKKSPIYGGYGDSKTLTVYSFDNLNALLAYRKVK